MAYHFNGTFRGCTGLTGFAPELWDRVVPELSGVDCYLNDTLLTNWDDIPEAWGGPHISSSSSSSVDSSSSSSSSVDSSSSSSP